MTRPTAPSPVRSPSPMSSRPLAPALAVGLALATGCGPSGFDPASLIESVRILASRSDQPYAKPGATVHSEVLAVDGRPDAGSAEPMRVFWLPFVCVNPANDAYYACFDAFLQNPSNVAQAGTSVAGISGAISYWDGGAEAGVGATALASDAGAGLDAGSFASLPTGVDISPFLIQGPRAVFHLPPDIVTSHPPAKGATQYGVAIVFNIACAGHIELVALDPNNANPEQIPFGCFDSQHQPVSANDYVFGYTEVFAYDSLTNQNPTIQSFTFAGKTLSVDGGLDAGVTFQHCDASASKCPDNFMSIDVPDASWERDPQNLGGPDGGPQGEQIWVDYYSSVGQLSEEAILLYDPLRGHVTPPKDEDLQNAANPGVGTIWAVVHDNRGGATWISVRATAQ